MSPVVTGCSIGGYNAAFFGYSNLGHAVRMNSGNLEYIAGFPYWSEDLGLSAPVVSDLDGDDLVEVLMVDDSGLMQLFDWNEMAGSGGWPTFQHDNWRTGYYGTAVPACTGSSPDVSISLAEFAGVDAATRGETASLPGRYVRALVEITGFPEETALPLTDLREQFAIPLGSMEFTTVRSVLVSGTAVEAASTSQRAVYIAALGPDGSILGRAVVRLENEVHEVRIALDSELPEGTRIAVAADPSNELAEADEGNNSFVIEGGSERSAALVEGIASRDGRVVVSLAPQPLGSDPEATVSLYSLDGRLVEQMAAEADTGLQVEIPSAGDALPAGCYMVVVEQGGTEFTRKVVVLR